MLAFLDKRNRMKYNILQVISSHKDTPVSLTDLQHATDSSIPTLNKLIDDILNDLTEINEPDVLMEIKDGSQKKIPFKKTK